MAGLIDPTDIAKARQSGYSDTEIASFLSEKHPDKFKAAREAGYNDKEILAHLSGDTEKPSGVVDGLSQGVSGVSSGIASTLGLAGIKSDTLDKVAANTAPKDYKAAPLIRKDGHWYNPSDWQPGNLPQFAAEMAPGLALDIAAGKTGASVGSRIGGIRGGVIGGVGAGLGSMALRTFGHGAHENAEARTGDANAPVTGSDMGREAVKQIVTAPINAVALNRFLPGVAGPALTKYLKTAATEGAAGGGRDAVGQAVTNAGQEHGKEFDANRTAEAAAGGVVLGGTLAAPKLAGDTASNIHFRNSERTPEARAGAEALASRIQELQGDRSLVGPLGGTKVAAEAVNNAHAAVHRELAAASKAEALSTDNANTLARINEGGKVDAKALKALADEASPETMHLAHQAIASAQLKSMGNLTADKFTGGLSGGMESLSPISNPVKAIGAAGLAAGVGHAAGLGLLGTYGFPAIGGILGTYGAARALDKLTGLRSPAKGFMDRYGGTDTPTRLTPAALPPEPPATTSVPLVAPPQNTKLWGSPKPELDASAQNADIQGMLRMAAARRNVAAQQAPPEAPRLDANSLNQQVKSALLMAAARRNVAGRQQAEEVAADSHAINEQGGLDTLNNPAFAKRGAQLLAAANTMRKLTAEPAAEEVPAPAAPVISPIAQKMLAAQLKKGLPTDAAPAPAAPVEAPSAPSFNPTALAMLKQRLKAGLPPEAPPAPAPTDLPKGFAATLGKDPVELPASFSSLLKKALPPAAPAAPAEVSPAPASDAIGALMQKLQGQSAPTADAAPVAPIPVAPVIAKINKAKGKPVEETPHPEEAFAKEYAPLAPEELWGKGMSDREFAQADAAKKTGLNDVEAYMNGIIRDRQKRRGILADLAGEGHEADQMHAASLLDELHHIRRADKAHGAIGHFTAKMSPGMKAAIRKRMDKSFINSMWST